MWYVYYTGQCGDAACAGAGNDINDNGWGYGEKRSDDAVEGGARARARGWYHSLQNVEGIHVHANLHRPELAHLGDQ